MHTIISGIESISQNTENVLRKVSTYQFKTIETKQQLIEALHSCDIFWFRLNHKLTKEILENSKCKFIVCAVTGLDHIDLESCKENNITVISLKGEFEFLKEVRATAEHTIGLLLTLIRKTKNAYSHVENGNWDRTQFQGTELYKKKVGIIGLGRLGKIVAEYYNVMGMHVFYYDINKQEKYENKYTAVNSIEALFKEIDVLSIHLPYNTSTHFILNEKNLNTLKKNALVVNTSRGGVIDEQALLNLLNTDKIAGYATDVLYGEPDIINHPLVKYAKKNNNVVITPHIGGNTFESIEKTELFVIQKLKKIVEQCQK
ncbi:NAD(P)-dependent oxidoreductase [Lacinutrix venerupis]|nr:D-isomer specific 2-hydroxyacid dehydrogenase family protein [Lacinutrix venerupis]